MLIVNFEEGKDIYIVRGLVQYDFGQILKISGLDTRKVAQAHFTLQGSATAIRILPADSSQTEYDIPDCLLAAGSDLTCYIYLVDDVSGETVKTIYLPVIRRARPDDYDPPEQPGTIDQILRLLQGKADNLSFNGGELQLLANGMAIGDKIRLPSGSGESAREIELKNSGTSIQWRYTNENEWHDLVLIEDLKGEDGQTPEFEIRDGHLFAIYQK